MGRSTDTAGRLVAIELQGRWCVRSTNTRGSPTGYVPGLSEKTYANYSRAIDAIRRHENEKPPARP